MLTIGWSCFFNQLHRRNYGRPTPVLPSLLSVCSANRTSSSAVNTQSYFFAHRQMVTRERLVMLSLICCCKDANND